MDTFQGFSSPCTSPMFVQADVHLTGFLPGVFDAKPIRTQPQPPPPQPTQQHARTQPQQPMNKLQFLVGTSLPRTALPCPGPQQQPLPQQQPQRAASVSGTDSPSAASSAPSSYCAFARHCQNGEEEDACGGGYDSMPAAEFLEQAQMFQDRAVQLWSDESVALQRGTELRIISTGVAAAVSPPRVSAPPPLFGSPTGQLMLRAVPDSLASSPLSVLSLPGCSPNVLDSLHAYFFQQPGSTPASCIRPGPFSQFYPPSQGSLFDGAGSVLTASGAGDELHGSSTRWRTA